MKKFLIRWLWQGGLVLALLTLLIGGPGAAAQQPPGAMTFPQTGYTLTNAHGFLRYWQAHGGLAQFGYPLSGENAEISPTDGRLVLTQWFERNRFEWHPENPDPQYQILLGLLGRELTRGREAAAPFQRQADPHAAGCLYFAETGHTLCSSFRAYWEGRGGLALYGFPLSEEFPERNPSDGKLYTVQYFERNRFEAHPENAGSPYTVLLGLLGVQVGGFPLAPLPQATTPATLQVLPAFQGDARWQTPRTLFGAPGMQISLYGADAGFRMMAVAPNGDLFVSETRPGKVIVLPDRNGDHVADETVVWAAMEKPHGLAFHNGFLYVATESAVWRFPYANGQLQAPGPGQQIADLPFGDSTGLVNDVNHDTRSLAFGLDDKMYVSAGSDCDLCEEPDPRRAAIMQFNDDGSGGRVFAHGLRNAVGLAIDPRTGRLWASVNERNARGNDRPPDLLTPIRDGGDYGWPYCMGIPLAPDPLFGRSADFCNQRDTAPLGLPPHSAPLGIHFSTGSPLLPPGYSYGIFLGVHGSTLHDPPYGYDVRFASLRPGQTAQGVQVAISGWLVDGKYWGRPVDVIVGPDGALYVSDDVAGAIYRVTWR